MSASDPNPAVSVVVPCYNGGRFIDQLLASLAQQTFRDFELIIVDDGSRDDTRAKLATLDESITVIRQDNAGPGAARNTGFARARAPIVLALDCDDTLDPTYLAETVSLMQSSPGDVGFIFTHERMTGLRHGTEPRYFKLFDQLFINRVPSCVVLRKKAWSDVGGYDARMREGYEDWEFTIALAAAGYRALVIPRPLFTYRVSDEGLLLRLSSKMHAELWRRMRVKHREIYRLPALVRLWWTTRHIPGELRLTKAVSLLTAASVLPDAWFNALIHRVRAIKMARTQNPPTTPANRSPVGKAIV
jgi:glycosyltransferase involved in cell wall biosynthesis